MAHKLPKKPKRPKVTASLAVWEKHDEKVKEWQKKCNDIKAAKKKKENLIKKHV